MHFTIIPMQFIIIPMQFIIISMHFIIISKQFIIISMQFIIISKQFIIISMQFTFIWMHYTFITMQILNTICLYLNNTFLSQYNDLIEFSFISMQFTWRPKVDILSACNQVSFISLPLWKIILTNTFCYLQIVNTFRRQSYSMDYFIRPPGNFREEGSTAKRTVVWFSSCLPKIKRCQPSGKISQASLHS